MIPAKRIAIALGLVLCFQAWCDVVGGRVATRSDGLHAAVWVPNQFGGPTISLWHNSTDLTNILVDAPNWVHPQPVFVGDRVVISDVPEGGIGPVTCFEYSLEGKLLDTRTFGDNNSRMGCGCSVKGGAVFVNFVTLGFNTPTFGMDVCYRKPPQPPAAPDAAAPDLWQYKRFWFNNPAPGAVIALMSSDEMNGMAHVGYMFDGAGVVGLLVISVTNGIQVALQNDSFIGRDSPVAPSIEIPEICVVKDGKGLVFAYQAAESTFHFECVSGSPTITGPTLFARVSPDLSVSKICQLPWDDFHNHAVVAPWPRPDAMYCYAGEVQNCIRSWWQARTVGTNTTRQAAAQGELRSFSSDGWVFTPDSLTLTPMLPKISIVPEIVPPRLAKLIGMVGIATISWDNFQVGDTLESSTDLKVWQTVAINQRPPIDVPMNTDRLFFRVKR